MRDGFRDRAVRRAIRELIAYADRAGDYFRTYHERPKRAGQLGTRVLAECPQDDCAIVMQGPVDGVDDFTLETFRIYARHMPACRLVLSTWSDTPDEILDPIRAVGVDVLLNEKPPIPGFVNINMQLVSAAAGVRHAVERGATWIVKSRTDQRFYDPDLMAVLIGLVRSFPAAAEGQRHRIVGLGAGSLLLAPYHLTDQTVFGHAEDMLVYWSAPLRTQALPAGWPPTLPEIFARVPTGELCRHGAAESYLASSFLERTGWRPTWTLEDSWAAFRDCFLVLDPGAGDFYWRKGHAWTLTEYDRTYDRVTNRLELGFREWLLLQSGQLPISAAQHYAAALDVPFNAPLPEAVDSAPRAAEALSRPGPAAVRVRA
ncbi:WavE lipopolysaccharide synthesis family protein [Salinarimonas sp.]|uniref:WavE lipopolysaccharide synthesis family protein n=1 Tax=Salinarimonas sp. TaxID=2766526 RepID=UPI0032D94FDD